MPNNPLSEHDPKGVGAPEKLMNTFNSKLQRNVKSYRLALACAAALVGASATATAFADPASVSSDGVMSVTVRIDDLNLTTADGTKALYTRITRAAREVCPDSYSRELARLTAGQKCQSEAVARAVQSLGNSQLAMVHAAHAPRG